MNDLSIILIIFGNLIFFVLGYSISPKTGEDLKTLPKKLKKGFNKVVKHEYESAAMEEPTIEEEENKEEKKAARNILSKLLKGVYYDKNH